MTLPRRQTEAQLLRCLENYIFVSEITYSNTTQNLKNISLRHGLLTKVHGSLELSELALEFPETGS